jgi:hypothetical protein
MRGVDEVATQLTQEQGVWAVAEAEDGVNGLQKRLHQPTINLRV